MSLFLLSVYVLVLLVTVPLNAFFKVTLSWGIYGGSLLPCENTNGLAVPGFTTSESSMQQMDDREK